MVLPAASQARSDGGAQTTNLILGQLPPAEFRRIRQGLTTVSLELKQSIWKPDQPIDAVYFPETMVVSILALTDGASVEVGTVGNEGVVGLPVFLGATSFAGQAMVQIPGQAQRLDAEAFRQASKDGQLRGLLQRYTLGFLTQVSQGTACNRTHSTEQRLARWLLTVRDRVGTERFPLTQEFMSQMLGVRRATVSETAAALQERRLIEYSRGVITLRNQKGLEKLSCECYGIIREEFQRLLGAPVG